MPDIPLHSEIKNDHPRQESTWSNADDTKMSQYHLPNGLTTLRPLWHHESAIRSLFLSILTLPRNSCVDAACFPVQGQIGGVPLSLGWRAPGREHRQVVESPI